MSGVTVRAAGIITGWGRGVAALPADAPAAGSRRVIAATPTPRTGDRLRRATRECLLAVDAVDALLEEGALSRDEIAGDGTALVYVTAAAYGAANRAFIEGGGGALHFPYTAPSAVPAEVAIEFGLHGPYAVLIGGARATVDALTHAATLLARGACRQALVLAVETFVECEDLFARGGWLGGRVLVEGAAAVLLHPGENVPNIGVSGAEGIGDDPGVGGTLACGPLVAVALARARGIRAIEIAGQWRERAATITMGVDGRGPHPAAA